MTFSQTPHLHTNLAVWRIRFHRIPPCYLCQSPLVTASKGLRTLSPWNVTRLEMSLPPCRSVWTFAVNSPRLSIFSPPGPEPFDGFRSTFGQSSWIHNWFFCTGVNSDSSVPTSLAICFWRVVASPSLVLSLGATSIGTSSGRPSPTLEMSYFGALCGRCWYDPNFRHTEQTGKFTERQPFTLGTDFGAFRAQGSTRCKTSDCSCFQSQQSKNGDSSCQRSPLQGSRNLPHYISVCFSLLEARSRWQRWHHSCGFFRGFMNINLIFYGVTVVWQHLKGPQINGPQWNMLWCFWLFFLATFSTFSFGCSFRVSSIKVSLGSAIRSDVTNASTAEIFFVGSTLPSTFSVAFARIVSGFGQHFLAVSDLQTVQFSIFTFHGFVTVGMVVVVFIAQSSDHHWSKTAGATVDDCYDVSFHVCLIWEQVLLCCQLFLKWGTWRGE